jgi:hypothetical protein
MQYIVLSVPDGVDTSALAVGAAATVEAVAATIVGKATWVNPTPETLVQHTHEVSASGLTNVIGGTGPAVGS